MKMRILFLSALACLAAAVPAQELISNGGFSDGTTGWDIRGGDKNDVAEYQKDGGHAGGCFHFKSSTTDPQGMVLGHQGIAKLPADKPLRLTFWAKGKDATLAVGVVRAMNDTGKMVAFATSQKEHPLKGTFDWTKVDTILTPTGDTTKAAVLLCLAGKGEVWFDDVSFSPASAEEISTQGDGPGLIEARGAFNYIAIKKVGETKLLIPMMMDYREQAPLNYRFNVTPKSALKATRVYEDKPGNYVAEVTLGALEAKDEVNIEWKSLVLVGKRSFDSLPETALLPATWPEEAKPWLKSTASVQAQDRQIQKVAKEIRGQETDTLKIITATLARTMSIYDHQQGRCTSLDAVQALTKQGSCTSCANLVTALLRANGIPTRIMAGYPLWSGPLQTHYIVEAYVPNYGWYPIESTQLQQKWQLYQQVIVAIVPPEYEDQSGMRIGGFTGVPYLSLTEFPDQKAPVYSVGTVDKEKYCDHEAKKVRVFSEPTAKWDEALKLAHERWQTWLKSSPTSLEVGKYLSSAKTLDEVIAALKG